MGGEDLDKDLPIIFYLLVEELCDNFWVSEL